MVVKTPLRKPAPSHHPTWAWVFERSTWVWAFVFTFLILGALCLFFWVTPQPQKGPLPRAKAHMQVVLRALIEHKEREGAWPACDGKNFVLSIVAGETLGGDDPESLRVLFSPIDRHRLSGLRGDDASAYASVTMERLVGGESFRELTSYAGRRNATTAYVLPREPEQPMPLIADDNFADFVLVGYSDGTVRELTNEELGLPLANRRSSAGRQGPGVILGDAASSPLLRQLSWD